MSDDFRANYERFIDQAIEFEVVWNLQSGDGYAICEANEFADSLVMPFWSDEKHAKAACVDDWQEYQPNPIRVDDFIDAWLHGLEEDEMFVGVNWNAELDGVEIEPVMLIEDLLGDE